MSTTARYVTLDSSFGGESLTVIYRAERGERFGEYVPAPGFLMMTDRGTFRVCPAGKPCERRGHRLPNAIQRLIAIAERGGS